MMVESNLLGDRQDFATGETPVYGRSITDSCIDWDTSVEVLERLARAVEQRRRRARATARDSVGSPTI